MIEAADKATGDHDYVPWILVDGKLVSEEDFMVAICDAYQAKGGLSPSCTELSMVKATSSLGSSDGTCRNHPESADIM